MMASLAEQFASRMSGATAGELAALEHSWEFWARTDQRQPALPWRLWLILAGRGWGKTRTGAETIREAVCEQGVERIALVGATAADARDVMVLGESGICAVFPAHQRPKYEPSKRRVVFHTGAIATIYSAEEPDRLRGPQHEMAWCDELAAWRSLDDTWSNLMMGLRLGEHPRVIVTTTPRPLDVLRALVAEAEDQATGVIVTRGRTLDNRGNLPDRFLSDIERAYGGTRLGRQELEGEILEPAGGLFQREWLRYMPTPPACSRVVVSVDPAITTRNDETGIVVVGRHRDEAYVLEDLSGMLSPEQWAERAVAAARRWKASSIVAETNRGGDLVRTTIRQVDRGANVVPIKEVRANRGKDTRAEPIAALYEQGRVWHAQRFEKLEKQMLEWSPTSQEAQRAARQATSPDRLDALVWGITELGFHLGVARGLAPLTVPLPKNRI
jgi:phage terminase large subunit-like protein